MPGNRAPWIITWWVMTQALTLWFIFQQSLQVKRGPLQFGPDLFASWQPNASSTSTSISAFTTTIPSAFFGHQKFLQMECSNCKKPAKLSCSGCKPSIALEGDPPIARYCGAECQKADWARHKPICSKVKDRLVLYRVVETAQRLWYIQDLIFTGTVSHWIAVFFISWAFLKEYRISEC